MGYFKILYEKSRRLGILEKSIWHDFKYTVPFSIFVGFCVETFMVKTGFYKILVKKEEEKLKREREEIKKAKKRIELLKKELKNE